MCVFKRVHAASSKLTSTPVVAAGVKIRKSQLC